MVMQQTKRFRSFFLTYAGWMAFGLTLAMVAGWTIHADTYLAVSALRTDETYRLVFSREPSSAYLGSVISPSIEVRLVDAGGNPISQAGVEVTINLREGTGSLSGTTVKRTEASGSVLFQDLRIDRPGSKVLYASAPGIQPVISQPFPVGLLSRLTFAQQPTNALLGEKVVPAIVVQTVDDQGYIAFAGNVPVILTMTGGEGNMKGTRMQLTAASGKAVFDDISFDTLGTKVLTAGSPDWNSAVSNSFQIHTVVARRLSFVQHPSNTPAGAFILPAVTVKATDDAGRPAADYTGAVTLALAENPGSGVLQGTLTSSCVAGVATFTGLHMAQEAEGYTLRAEATGLIPAVSQRFNIFTAHPNRWTSNGPDSTAERLAIRLLTVHPFRSGILYAVGPGGVWRSTDSGANWTEAGDGLPSPEIHALAIPWRTTDVVLAGTGSGLYRTTNRGENWEPFGVGLPPGAVHSLAFDPTSDSGVYAGTVLGVYKSTNGGAVWTPSHRGLTQAYVRCLAIPQGATNTVYAGVPGRGVFQSADGGGTWTTMDSGLPDSDIVDLTVRPIFPFTVFVGLRDRGVYKWNDSNFRWVEANAAATRAGVTSLSMHPGNPKILYAGTWAGVYKSIDDGVNWSKVADPSVSLPQAYDIAFSAQPLPTLWVATAAGVYSMFGGKGSELYFAQQPAIGAPGVRLDPPIQVQVGDNLADAVAGSGATITLQLSQGTGILSGNSVQVTDGYGIGRFADLSVDQTGVKGLTASSPGLISVASQDFYINLPAWGLAFLQAPQTALVGQKTAVDFIVQLRDRQGGDVHLAGVPITLALESGPGLAGKNLQTTDSMGRASFSGMSFDWAGQHKVVASNPSLVIAVSEWISVVRPVATRLVFGQQPQNTEKGKVIRPDVSLQVVDPNGIVVADPYGIVTISLLENPGGAELTGTLTVPLIRGTALFSDLRIDKPANRYLLRAVCGSFQVHSDWFNIYETQWKAWARQEPSDVSILSLAVNPASSDTLYAGTDRQGLYRSTDGGLQWGRLAEPNGLAQIANEKLNAVVVHPLFPSVILVGTEDHGVFKSTDGGTTWMSSNTGLSSNGIRVLTRAPSSPDSFWLGSDQGVYRSGDGGSVWIPCHSGMDGASVRALAIDPEQEHILYAGTAAGGIFKSNNGGILWSAAHQGLTGPALSIRALALQPNKRQTIYAATGAGVYRSTNGGIDWTAASAGLPGPDISVSALSFSPGLPLTLYCATSAGVFLWREGEQKWEILSGGAVDWSGISSLLVADGKHRAVYAGGTGIYTIRLRGPQFLSVLSR